MALHKTYHSTGMPGEAQCEMWADHDTDEMVVHNFHDPWSLNGMLDEIAHSKAMVQGTPQENQVVAHVPQVLYWQWRNEWQQHHSDRVTWDVFKINKINDRDYQKLRLYSEVPLVGKNAERWV